MNEAINVRSGKIDPFMSLTQAVGLLKRREVSSVDLTKMFFDRIQKYEALNAFTTLTMERALIQAKESDQRLKEKTGRLLEGAPVGVKDLFCVRGVSSTSCSKILEGFKPTYDSKVTENLFNAGAIMLGKTNMDEFAMGSATTNSAYGACISPWKRNDSDAPLTSGGSSGGSASAVAAGLCLGALGTDTGGSIRQPSAFTGTVGVKPTYGRCSRWGMIAFASSLDQAGVMTRTVGDAALMLEAICGHDPRDATSVNKMVPEFTACLGQDIKGMKVGVPKEYHTDDLPEDIDALWKQGIKWLEAEGAEIIPVSLPHTHYALPTYYIIAPAEASSNLSRYDGVRYGLRVCDEGDSIEAMYEKTRAAGFGDEVKRRIMMGTYVLSAGYYDAYYRKAQRVRTLISKDFTDAFEKVDVLLTPTTPTPAFGIEEKLDPIHMYLNDIFTVPASLAGLPAMSVPSGLSRAGLPLGLQLIGKAFAEETLFKVGSALETQAMFNVRPEID